MNTLQDRLEALRTAQVELGHAEAALQTLEEILGVERRLQRMDPTRRGTSP